MTNEITTLKNQEYISPSSISTYYKCPRQYYYQYIEKIKTPPTIHLLKGTIIHSILEDFFKMYEINFSDRINRLFDSKLLSYKQSLESLNLTPEELIIHIKDMKNMIDDFVYSFTKKVNNIVDIGQANNDEHAFNILRPKFKEKYVKNDTLHCKGYIDRVDIDYDGRITLGDYKTSKKTGLNLNEDYKRQMAIYALLYGEEENIYPSSVAIMFLRYNETYYIDVMPSLLKYARDCIEDVYSKTRSISKDDYQIKEQKLCPWCNYFDICNGKKHSEEKNRLDKIKELILDKTDKIVNEQ